jgi:hypothetical protein
MFVKDPQMLILDCFALFELMPSGGRNLKNKIIGPLHFWLNLTP